MKDLLDDVRSKFGAPPRHLNFLTRWRLRAPRPTWIRPDDELIEILHWQNELLNEGEIVWGALVQANGALFQQGDHDLPALTVYAEDQSFDNRPGRLLNIAERLGGLKGTTPADPLEREYAEMITNEMERALDWMAPPTLTDGKAVRSSGFIVFRQHLPDKILRGRFFPLLVHPETAAVMIVPNKYWPDELVQIWFGD